MALHPVLLDKLNAALAPAPPVPSTRRERLGTLRAPGAGFRASRNRGFRLLGPDAEPRGPHFAARAGDGDRHPALQLSNLGHALETVVLNELERRKAAVGYVKTAAGFEVDFHVRYLAAGEELVQVCEDPTRADGMARELRALDEATAGSPEAKRLLLVLTRDQALPKTAPGVLVQPAYEWLLAAPE
jgi:hypothetical protein